jgi:hypothetical protein
MSDKSPLFVSASELLAHSIDLYTQGKERKYKFIILHLANAIELILKDRVIDIGLTIYKPKSPYTITIWEAFEELNKASIAIPERPVIELLVDDRNTIQHRFGFPNADAVFYYLGQVLAFFRRFLNDEYNVDLVELLKLYVSEEDLAVVGLIEKEDESEPLDKLFELSPEAALLQAYSLLESKLMQYMQSDDESRRRRLLIWQHPDFPHLLDDLAIEGYISHDSVHRFRLLRDMRNRAAHSAHFQGDVPREDWGEALAIAKDLISGIEKAAEANLFSKRSAWREKQQNNESDESLDKNARNSEEKDEQCSPPSLGIAKNFIVF